MMLGRRFVFRLDDDLGAGQGGLGVADLGQVLVLLRNFGRVFFGHAGRSEGRARGRLPAHEASSAQRAVRGRESSS